MPLPRLLLHKALALQAVGQKDLDLLAQNISSFNAFFCAFRRRSLPLVKPQTPSESSTAKSKIS
jgi:hypothetical protein